MAGAPFVTSLRHQATNPGFSSLRWTSDGAHISWDPHQLDWDLSLLEDSSLGKNLRHFRQRLSQYYFTIKSNRASHPEFVRDAPERDCHVRQHGQRQTSWRVRRAILHKQVARAIRRNPRKIAWLPHQTGILCREAPEAASLINECATARTAPQTWLGICKTMGWSGKQRYELADLEAFYRDD